MSEAAGMKQVAGSSSLSAGGDPHVSRLPQRETPIYYDLRNDKKRRLRQDDRKISRSEKSLPSQGKTQEILFLLSNLKMSTRTLLVVFVLSLLCFNVSAYCELDPTDDDYMEDDDCLIYLTPLPTTAATDEPTAAPTVQEPTPSPIPSEAPTEIASLTETGGASLSATGGEFDSVSLTATVGDAGVIPTEAPTDLTSTGFDSASASASATGSDAAPSTSPKQGEAESWLNGWQLIAAIAVGLGLALGVTVLGVYYGKKHCRGKAAAAAPAPAVTAAVQPAAHDSPV